MIKINNIYKPTDNKNKNKNIPKIKEKPTKGFKDLLQNEIRKLGGKK